MPTHTTEKLVSVHSSLNDNVLTAWCYA